MAALSTGLARPGKGPSHVVSTGLEHRLQEKRQAQRRLRWRRLGQAVAAVLAVAVVAWLLLASPLLGLSMGDVEVYGSDGTVSDEQVREALGDQQGTSLLLLDVDELGEQVTAALVRVRSAQVSRVWPHGLRVSLTMREPVAVRQVEQGFEVLDAEAVVLETAAAAPTGLAVVQTVSGQEPDASMVSAVTTAVGALDPATRARVSVGSVTVSGQVTLQLDNGASVVWGDSSEPGLKADVLRVLLGTEAKVYDVSSPRSPATS